ncbi:MAG TPA: hypothetical protein VKY85_17800, partial [Candidatus Angelobacter sp.]|nr:hypothetical protein [Candidatus Angelobacter sp.]
LDEAPHRSRRGPLPPLALVGTRACFPPAPGSLRELSLECAKVLAAFAASWDALAKARMREAKPPFAGNRSQRGGLPCSGCWGNLRASFPLANAEKLLAGKTRVGCGRSPTIFARFVQVFCVLAVYHLRHCPPNPGSLLTTNSTN